MNTKPKTCLGCPNLVRLFEFCYCAQRDRQTAKTPAELRQNITCPRTKAGEK